MITTSFRRWQLAIFAGVALIIGFVPFPARHTIPTERTFYLDAMRFQYSPAVLEVNPGDTVHIVLSTRDVMHGISMDGYNVSTMAQPTRPGNLTFVADRTGVFRFHCTVVCGNMHPFMTGKLVVGQNTLFFRSIALLGLAMIAGIMWGRK